MIPSAGRAAAAPVAPSARIFTCTRLSSTARVISVCTPPQRRVAPRRACHGTNSAYTDPLRRRRCHCPRLVGGARGANDARLAGWLAAGKHGRAPLHHRRAHRRRARARVRRATRVSAAAWGVAARAEAAARQGAARRTRRGVHHTDSAGCTHVTCRSVCRCVVASHSAWLPRAARLCLGRRAGGCAGARGRGERAGQRGDVAPLSRILSGRDGSGASRTDACAASQLCVPPGGQHRGGRWSLRRDRQRLAEQLVPHRGHACWLDLCHLGYVRRRCVPEGC